LCPTSAVGSNISDLRRPGDRARSVRGPPRRGPRRAARRRRDSAACAYLQDALRERRAVVPGGDRGAARQLAARDMTLAGHGLADRYANLEIRLGIAEGVIADEGRAGGRYPRRCIELQRSPCLSPGAVVN